MSERAFSSEYVYMGEWASAQSGPVRHARATSSSAAIYSVFSSFLFLLSADVCPSLSPPLSSVSPPSPRDTARVDAAGLGKGERWT